MTLIYRRTQSLRLQDKIKRLLDFSPEKYVTEEFLTLTSNQNTAFALTAIVKARLWKLSQRKLYDRTAARRLKPLGFTAKAFEQSLGSRDILDGGYTSSQGTDVLDQALGTQEMLDEGYCSQEMSSVIANDDDKHLLLAAYDFALEEELDDSDVLFGEEDAGIDDDLCWEEEDCTKNENSLEEDLFFGEEATIIDDLSQEGLDLLDDTKYHTMDALSEITEDEVLEDQIHHIVNHDLLGGSSWGVCAHSQAGVTEDGPMLLNA